MPWIAALIGAAGSIGGALLSKGGDDETVTTTSATTPGSVAKQYWRDEIRRMSGIQSGKIQPTELPEFQRMAGQANTQGNQSLQRMIQELSKRGITGGAAGQAISTNQTGLNQNILKMIQDIYSQANQRGNIAAGQLGSNSKQQMTRPEAPQSYPIPDLSNAFAAMSRNMGSQDQYRNQMADYYNQTYNNPQSNNYYQGW